MKINQSEFKSPAREHTGTELFMLNGNLTRDEIISQMSHLHEQGFHSLIARTYIGIETPYLSDEFMERMKDITEEAQKYGMNIYLQAGFMPAGIPDLPAAYAQNKVKAVKKELYKASDGEILCEHNGYVFQKVIYPYSIDMLSKPAMQYYLKASYEDFWKALKDKFGTVCRSVWVDEPDFGYIDLPWTNELENAFQSEYGYDIKDKLYLLFMDEDGCRKVRYQFWRLVTALLKDGYYSEVANWCSKNNLEFSGHLMCEDSMRIQILHTANCMPLYRYFTIPGIDMLSTNMNWPKHNYNNYRFIQTPLQCASIAHQTGKTEVLAEMFGVSSENLTFEKQKYIFDHLAVLGINHRCIHAIFYSLKGARKRRYVPHINYYQPYFNDYHLFNEYCARVSYFAKCADPYAEILVMSPIESAYCDYTVRYDGSYAGQIHSPFTKVPALGEKKDNFVLDELEETDNNFSFLLRKLCRERLPFELGDEDTINDLGSISNGSFTIGHMTYQTVLLPNIKVMRASTLTLLDTFLKSGGVVIVDGPVPAVYDSESISAEDILCNKPNVIFTKDTDDVIGILKNTPHLFSFTDEVTSGDVSIQLRKKDGELYVILFNGNEKDTYKGTLQFDGTFSAEQFNAVNGEIIPYQTERKDGKTNLSIKLMGGESILLKLTQNKVLEHSQALAKTNRKTILPIDGTWKVDRTEKNVLLLEYCTYKTENGSFSEQDMPTLPLFQKLCDEHYTGEITLKYTFAIDGQYANCSFVGEQLCDKTIRINGKEINNKPDGYYLAKDFETIAIQDLLQQGQNTVEISCHFIPYEKPKDNLFTLIKQIPGTELEHCYIIGDFAVESNTEPTDSNCIRFNRNFKITDETHLTYGELTTSGYPFYAGTFQLEKTISIDNVANNKVFLTFEKLDLCLVKVFVNDAYCGVIYCKPYKVELTKFLKGKVNTIRLEGINTIRNIIGPFHRPIGEKYETWGRYSGPDEPWIGGKNPIVPNWYEHRTSDSSMWVESYLQIPQGFSEIAISFDS